MSADHAQIAASVIGIIATIAVGFRWLVRAYLRELVPNGGSSMADRIGRIESNQTRIHERIDAIYDHLVK